MRHGFRFLICASLFLTLSLIPSRSFAANLIANPSMETAGATAPTGWATDLWGTTKATFTYPTGGAQDGTRYVKTQITTKGTGDAKWYPTAITASAGQTYTFSDWYQSTVASTVEVEVLLTSGSRTYISLGAPPISATWTQFSKSFTTPANTKSITIFHFIQAVGTLSVDSYALDNGTILPPQKPTINSFTAVPSTITQGANALLSWSVTNASSTSIDQGIGIVAGTSQSVSPLATTTYTITATNPAGSVTSSVTVNVAVPPPPPPPKPVINSFTATPITITQGASATLAWDITNASSTSINQGVGTVTGTSKSVSPTATTTYTISATNPGGVSTATVTVNVIVPPAPPLAKPTINSFTAVPSTITQGANALLSWSVTNASSTSIDQGIGIVAGTSQSVAPLATTTYTLTATNPAGFATSTVTVNVSVPTGTTTQNFVPNPSVETAASGGATPVSWQKSNWGTNTRTYEYLATGGHTGQRAVKVSITKYTSGDAKWMFTPITTLTPGKTYRFSAWYKPDANTKPHVVAQYIMADGSEQFFGLPDPEPAGTDWQYYSDVFPVFPGAQSVSVFFFLSGVGAVTTDDYKIEPYTYTPFTRGLVTLTFDDGFEQNVTTMLPVLAQYGFKTTQCTAVEFVEGPPNEDALIRQLAAGGHEICSHLYHHLDMTTMSISTLDSELSYAKNYLQNLNVGPITDFTSPFGAYNTAVVGEIKKYYESHRTTNEGFNAKDTLDPYRLKVQNMTPQTTLAQFQSWVNQAKADKTWLVIIYHAIVAPGGTANDFDTYKTEFDQQMAWLSTAGVTVESMHDALHEALAQ